MLITQTHPLSKISFLYLNVHIKMVTGCDSIEQFLPLQTLGTNKSSGEARANRRGVHSPCGCIELSPGGAYIVKILL
jgi:hypothetical protein